MDWGAIGTASGLLVIVTGALAWFLKKSTAWDSHLEKCDKEQEGRLVWQAAMDRKMETVIAESAATRKSLEDCWRVLMHDSQSRSPYFEMRSPLKLKEGVECKVHPEILAALKMYNKDNSSSILLLSYLMDSVGLQMIIANAKECNMNIFEFVGYLEEKVV